MVFLQQGTVSAGRSLHGWRAGIGNAGWLAGSASLRARAPIHRNVFKTYRFLSLTFKLDYIVRCDVFWAHTTLQLFRIFTQKWSDEKTDLLVRNSCAINSTLHCMTNENTSLYKNIGFAAFGRVASSAT